MRHTPIAAALAAILLTGLPAGAAEPPAQLRLGVVAATVARVAGLPVPDRLEPFRRRLAAALGKPVTLAAQPDGRALVEALAAGRVDYAILSASAYAAAEAGCRCLEPLAVPRAADGAAGWRAAIVVRADSAVRDVAGLKGASLAVPAADAFAGRAYALAELRRAGLAEADLARLDEAGGAEAAARAVAAGRAEAALIWLPAPESAGTAARGVLALMAEHRALPAEGLRPVWQGPVVPHGPHAVRAELPVAWRVKLRELLLHLQADDPAAYDAVEPEFGGGFAAVDKAAFDGLVAALAAPR